MKYLAIAAAFVSTFGVASAIVFPDTGAVANNVIPFGSNQQGLMDQVFASSLFSAQTGGLPALIGSIGFAPGTTGSYSASLGLLLGYTNATPGVASSSGGLKVPVAGNSDPNLVGAFTTFYSNSNYTLTVTNGSGNNFTEFVLPGTFVYNPALGNLLVQISANVGATTDLSVSRAAGGPESSRSYSTTRFNSAESPGTALRMDFQFKPVPEPVTVLAVAVGLAGLIRKRRAQQ